MTGQDIDLTVKPDFVEMSYSDLIKWRSNLLGMVDLIERECNIKPRTAKLRSFYKAWSKKND